MEVQRFRLAPEPIHPHAQIQAQRVTKSEFAKLQATYPPVQKILMSQYIQSASDEVILNGGAGPCSLIYIIDSHTGLVFASHMPVVSQIKSNEEIRHHCSWFDYLLNDPSDSIRIPNQHETLVLSRGVYDGGFSLFCKMEEAIRSYIETHDPQTIEAHLFGQNIHYYPSLQFRENLPLIQDMAAEQVLLSLRLQHIGLLASRIVDHRTITVDKTDNTLYVPENHTIYHHEDMIERFDLTADYFHDIFPT